MPASPLSLTVQHHIADVPADVWDQILEPHDIQASHRFITICQDSNIENATYRHVVVRQIDKVVATATFSAFSVGLDVLATGSTRRMLTALRSVAPNLLRVPVVFCGLPVSFGRSCLRWSGDAKSNDALRLDILHELDKVAADLAAEIRAPVICFKEFNQAESALASGLVELDYFRAPSLPGCRLDIRWSSADGYSGAMRSPYRRQLLAARRQRHRDSLEVRLVDDWRSESVAIHALYEQVIDRATARLERLPPAFFESLATLEEARGILIEHRTAGRKRLVAAAIVLDIAGECTFLLIGMDYENAHRRSTYHTAIDAVIEHAIESGARIVELGQTAYPGKTRMGAVATGRDLFIRGTKAATHRCLSLMKGILFPETVIEPRRVFRH